MAKLLLLAVLVICAVGYAKHIHPRTMARMEEVSPSDTELIPTDIDGMPIEVITNIKPTWFVPPNNMLFFMQYPPCEDGFKRDVHGVCREVWD